jgi:two-component system chemotaxis response regulator CheB
VTDAKPPTKLLVVDDSPFNRRFVAEGFAGVSEVQVVARAADGQEALDLTFLHRPDVITLDLEMPRMDGFTFLRILMARLPTPVIIVSSYSQRENVFKALELGAVDFVTKPDFTQLQDAPEVRDSLVQKVLALRSRASGTAIAAGAAPVSATSLNMAAAGPASAVPAVEDDYAAPKKLVVIGASTGGPSALLNLFGVLTTASRAAFAIAQHMPDKFTRTFSERLDKRGPIRVREAQGGETLGMHQALVCPGKRNLELVREQGVLRSIVKMPDSEDRYVPSVDRLFKSAAAFGGRDLIAVVLTGMGDDGLEGARAVKDAGGLVIIESQESAVVFGMPGAVHRAGLADHVLPIRQIGPLIVSETR